MQYPPALARPELQNINAQDELLVQTNLAFAIARELIQLHC